MLIKYLLTVLSCSFFFSSFVFAADSGGLFSQKSKAQEDYYRFFSLKQIPVHSPQSAPERGWLGIAMKPLKDNPDTTKDKSSSGFLVDYVIPASPAKKYGLLSGDKIIGFNEHPLGETEQDPLSEFSSLIRKEKGGSEVLLTLIREEEEKKLLVTLGKLPKEEPRPRLHPEILQDTSAKKSRLELLLEKEELSDKFLTLLSMINDTSRVIPSYKLYQGRYNPFRIHEIDYLLLHPLHTPLVASEIKGAVRKISKESDSLLSDLVVFLADRLDISLHYQKKKKEEIPDILSLSRLLQKRTKEALSLRKEAFGSLTDDDIAFLYEKGPYILYEGEEKEELLSDDDLLRLLKVTLTIDYEKLFLSALPITDLIDVGFLSALQGASIKERSVASSEFGGDVIDVIETEVGLAVIGGPGTTYYYGDAAIIIDLGGDDFYFNNAGGATPALPFSILIDLSGDDTYITNTPFSQGAAILGVGILIDRDGNDRYSSGSYSQGAGLFGVGILLDEQGEDQYFSDCCSQGAGMFGIGVLIEQGEKDSYQATRFSQGFGFTKGYGLLLESSGDDTYVAGNKYRDFRDPEKSYLSMSQGFGFGLRPGKSSVGTSGGIGMLYDLSGDDFYKGDYFSQGASYWYSLGMLMDERGNDRYVSGRYSQGAATHSTIGILADREGNDSYISSYGVAQGSGHDLAAGFLLDSQGNDYYKGGVMVQGAGNSNGLGILYDNQGKDRYNARADSQGYGEYFKERTMGSFGILYDSTGKEGDDVFSLADEQSYRRSRWGLIFRTTKSGISSSKFSGQGKPVSGSGKN